MQIYLFFLAVMGIGIVVVFSYQGQLLSSIFGLPVWAVNVFIGGGSGLLIGGVLLIGWRFMGQIAAKEGESLKIINGGAAAIGGAVLGIIVCVGLDFIFFTGHWLKIVQGVILLSGTLFGFRLGYGYKGSLFSSKRTTAAQINRQVGGKTDKIIDTSSIIDGRIGDLVNTGFIDGPIIIPGFILTELHGIADSSNNLRRRKGRRGLEILNELMSNRNTQAQVLEKDYPAIKEVDRKLIQLVKDIGGSLITTDYNLNRVASVENIKVLNVNELANAVKPRFIPGEELLLNVIDRGEGIDQGIGYLDDGTMVVVKNGRRFIGQRIKTTVTSALQTEAGRMLFVEPHEENSQQEE
ncbi:hypothetical protein LM599_05855 [Candidatus Acetothermia bacterium]|nr:hypothetical protein [Candidatus Acetothermia bacterium]MCI2427740.1 hypothetical protein [Candidatus Acetothermia bacterium]MCI2428811.1 hypothetical protein [Candidatus Acetothermia bacterium]